MTWQNLLYAVFVAGLPLFLLSFALVAWALHRGWLEGETVREIQVSIKALEKAQKDKKRRRRMDPALGKWFSFGGGFYGLVAVYTLLLIEWADMVTFMRGLGGIVIDLHLSALIRLVVELIVNSIMNFVQAIGWPVYWLSQSRSAWILLFVAYAGYWTGMKTAHYAWRRGWVAAVEARITSRFGGGGAKK